MAVLGNGESAGFAGAEKLAPGRGPSVLTHFFQKKM
jgi:hypothetical protein